MWTPACTTAAATFGTKQGSRGVCVVGAGLLRSSVRACMMHELLHTVEVCLEQWLSRVVE